MGKEKRTLKIGTKTLLSHLVLALCVALLAGVLSDAIAFQYLLNTRIDDLERKAQRIAENTLAMSDGSLMPGRRTMHVYQILTDSSVYILDNDTEHIRMRSYRHDAPQGGEELEWFDIGSEENRRLALQVLQGKTVSKVHHFSFTNSKVLFAAAPVVDSEGAVRGGVVLAQPIDQLMDFARGMFLILLGGVGAAMILAALLATHLTRRLVRPIQQITSAARRMTEDDSYAERITNLPNDEIGDLGRTLNCMSARLIDVIGNLRKERDKLELLITSIGEGVFAVDRQGHIVHANEAFLELMELERAQTALESGDEGCIKLRELIERCTNAGEGVRGEWKNPSGRALEVRATPLADEDGAFLGTVCLLRDASETQRMEQLRREYVANVSHELRTPLTGIRGMVEPLIDGVMETEEERQDCYQVILRETIRLEKLVGEMLDISRLQDGRISLELELLELPGILEAAARNMKPIAENAGVSLRVETDGSKLACLGNEDRIMQVLIILIDNALSFTPAGGEVVIFARDDGARVALGVRDNGCGIEPKDLPFIWERFYKADKSRMRTTGTGLGLAIAKLVTELMGGEIGVKSEPGKGAEFTFTLNKQQGKG